MHYNKLLPVHQYAIWEVDSDSIKRWMDNCVQQKPEMKCLQPIVVNLLCDVVILVINISVPTLTSFV